MANAFLRTKKFRDFDLATYNGAQGPDVSELQRYDFEKEDPILDREGDVFLVGYRVERDDDNGSKSGEFKIHIDNLEPKTDWDELHFHIEKIDPSLTENVQTTYQLWYNTEGETEFTPNAPWQLVTGEIDIPKVSQDKGGVTSIDSYSTTFYDILVGFSIKNFDPVLIADYIDDGFLALHEPSGRIDNRTTALLGVVNAEDENHNKFMSFWYYIPEPQETIAKYVSGVSETTGGFTVTTMEDDVESTETIEFPEPIDQLADLEDVRLASVEEGDILTYDGTNHYWYNLPGSGGPIGEFTYVNVGTVTYTDGIAGVDGQPDVTVTNSGNSVNATLDFTFENLRGAGIANITGPATAGLVDTYTITYGDQNTTKTFTVTNGRDGLPGTTGAQGPQGPQGPSGKGIQNITGPATVPGDPLAKKYTIYLTDNTYYDFTVHDGNYIENISGPSTFGLVDTYTMNFKNGMTETFTVTNGRGIYSIVKAGSTGLVDHYGIAYTDGTASSFDVTNGAQGIQGPPGNDGADGKGITYISGPSRDGLIDTYTIHYTDNATTTFTVTNGATGQTGAPGADGADGTTFELYRVTLTNGYTDVNGGNAPSLLRYDTISWQKFESGAFGSPLSVSDIPTFSAGDIIDVCPDTESAVNVCVNLKLGAFGLLETSNNVTDLVFYTVPVILQADAQTFVFTIKVYSNIQ